MRFQNDLQRLPRAAYDECVAYVTERLIGEGIASQVVKFGTVRHPGISDLDLLVVLARRSDGVMARAAEIVRSAPHGDYCFHHPPSYIAADDLRYAHVFHSLRGIEDEIDFDLPFGPLQQLAWNAFFYRITLEALAREECSLRYALLLVNNMAQTIAANDIAAGTDEHALFAAEVDAVRNASLEAFDSETARRLEQLFQKSMEIANSQERAIGGAFRPRLPRWGAAEQIWYLPGRRLSLRAIRRGTRAMTLPDRYFSARAATQRLVRNLGIPEHEYWAIRDRLEGVPILGY